MVCERHKTHRSENRKKFPSVWINGTTLHFQSRFILLTTLKKLDVIIIIVIIITIILVSLSRTLGNVICSLDMPFLFPSLYVLLPLKTSFAFLHSIIFAHHHSSFPGEKCSLSMGNFALNLIMFGMKGRQAIIPYIDTSP